MGVGMLLPSHVSQSYNFPNWRGPGELTCNMWDMSHVYCSLVGLVYWVNGAH